MNKKLLNKMENFILKSLEAEARRVNLLKEYDGKFYFFSFFSDNHNIELLK